MDIINHNAGETQIAEVISNDLLIQCADDGLDLLGNLYYQGFDHVILHQKNIAPEFFDLKNKMAGDILQKFSTYRVRLVIVGDYSGFSSKSLKDFIRESNRGKQVNFLNSVSEAMRVFLS